MAIIRYRDGNGNIVPLRVIQGEDGKQMFVRFSAHADGTDMSEVWDAARDWMGVAFAPSAPKDPAAYQWIHLTSLSFGRYPEEGSAERYLFFVGGGTGEDDRRNAMTLSEEGDLEVSGGITFAGRDLADEIARLDGRIDGRARVVKGTYTGTGYQYNRIVTLPFAAKMVFIVNANGWQDNFYEGLGVSEKRETCLLSGTTLRLGATRVADGVNDAARICNASGVEYTYFAIG